MTYKKRDLVRGLFSQCCVIQSETVTQAEA